MNRKNHSYLLDTNIQVKRLLSEKWKQNNLDSIWKENIPLTSIYSLMEFKNCVIVALKFLIDVLNEINNQNKTDDDVEARLSEVIGYINMDTVNRTTDRKTKIANSYAAKLLKENKLYPKIRTIDEVIEQLNIEAENLIDIWFFHYPNSKKMQKMELVNIISCELGEKDNPLNKKKYTCIRGERNCNITEFLSSKELEKVLESIKSKELKLNCTRLKKGIDKLYTKIRENDLSKGKSIGQSLCWPVGDYLLSSKANNINIGIFTADKDLVKFSNFFKIKSLFYDLKLNAFIENKN